MNMAFRFDILHEIVAWNKSSSRIFNSEINNNNNLYTFDNNELHNFYNTNGKWSVRLLKDLSNTLIAGDHKLRHVFAIDDDKDLLVMTEPRGIRIYMRDKETFNLTGWHLAYYNEFNWNSQMENILFGRFYYNSTAMGLITSHQGENIQFGEIFQNFNEFVVQTIHVDVDDEFNRYCLNHSKLMLIRLNKRLQKMLLCQSTNNWTIFQFHSANQLRFVMKIPCELKEIDKIFFSNLSRHFEMNDLVVFNRNGMYLYQFSEDSSNVYDLVNYNGMFSRVKGWTERHTESVRFEDVNNDGGDDLIFTGPAGIGILTFNAFTNSWQSLISSEELQPQQRHSQILHVMPGKMVEKTFVTEIFLLHSNGIHLGRIVEVTKEMPMESTKIDIEHSKTLPDYSDSDLLPLKIAEDNEPTTTIFLRDLNIWSDQLNSVNPKTGKPEFVLPLIGEPISSINFQLYFDGTRANSRADNVLGIGWSMPQNYIQQKDDDNCLLMVENIVYNFKLLFVMSTDRLFVYELDDGQAKNASTTTTTTTRAIYNVTRNTWEVTFGYDRKNFYGFYDDKHFGAISTGSQDRSTTVDTWHLAIAEIDGVNNYYEYQVLKKTNDSKDSRNRHDGGALLKRIHDGRNELEFFYNMDSYSLSQYTYKSPSKEQTIQFKYSKMGNSHILTTIEQISDPVMKFTYSEPARGKYVLEKILLPTEVEIIFEYMALGEPMPINQAAAAAVTRIPLPNETDYNISYGSDFILVSYLDTDRNRIILRMFNNDMSEEMYSSLRSANATKAHWPMLDAFSETIETYQISLENSYLIVNIYSSPNRIIYAFGKLANGNWQKLPLMYKSREECTVLGAHDFFLISDPYSEIIIIDWWPNDGKWNSPVKIHVANILRVAVAVFHNRFAIYDDENIILGFRDSKNVKKFHQIQLTTNSSGYLSQTLNVVKKFDLERNFEKVLLGFFRNNAIQMNENFIVLSSLTTLNATQLATKIRVFVIEENHGVAFEEDMLIPWDNIEDLISPAEINTDGEKFTLKYFNENGKFRIKLNSLKGDSSFDKFGEKIYEKMNSPAQRFFLDYRNYFVRLRGRVLMCGNRSSTFDGRRWLRSKIDESVNSKNNLSIPLGDEFVLRKSTATETLKLLNGRERKILFDFDVENLSDLRVNYPIYIASQAEGKPINLIEFNENGNETSFAIASLPQQQKLTQFANAISLVTLETSSDGNKTLLIRPMYDGRFLPNFVVKSSKIVIPGETGGSKQRVTGYSYELSSAHLIGDTYVYDQSSVFPGNDSKSNGYIEYHDQFVQFFNENDELIKQDQLRDGNLEEHFKGQDNQKDAKLFDKHGHLEIGNCSPFKATSDMCGFIGFEDYEATSSANWMFNQTNVIRGKFTLTGRNYLHLDVKAMKGIFRPKFSDQLFVASCWLRIPFQNLPKLGDIVAYLRAIVLTESGKEVGNFLADVKYQIGDWSYMEVTIDLAFAHLMLIKIAQIELSGLQIEIRVSPSTQFPIDVDNVRFSPLNHIFEVNVYDMKRSRPVAIIKSSGAIVRHLYDKYGVRIAEINESNQIREFVTYTKGSHKGFGGRANPPCAIKLIPEITFYDDFSPNSFRTHWRLTNMKPWTISPNCLRHNTMTRHEIIFENRDIDRDSFGLRFLYSFQKNSLINIGGSFVLFRTLKKSNILMSRSKKPIQIIPDEGEFLLVKEKKRVVVWIDGVVYYDCHRTSTTILKFIAQGELSLRNLMVFSRPHVHVIYKNALNEDIQQISLTSMDSVVVKELLYDEVGRQRITVQPVEVTRKPEESILSYAADLVTNDDPSEINSVWRTGELEGKINRILGHPFGFSEIVFEKNPLNVKSRVGMPGKIFSSSGNYAQRFNSTTANSFLLERYPPRWNFTYHVQSKISFDEISIYNKENLKVASYIDVEGSRDLFSTFEYNEKGFLVKYLPPMYYNDFGSFDRETHDLTYVPQFNELQEQRLATCISYNDGGHLTRKTTPDTGLVENVYDDDGGKQLRFRIQYSRKNPSDIEAITYLAYDEFGRLVSRGNLREPFPSNQLLKLNISEANAEEYQRFHHSDLERDTALRGRVLRTITKSQNEELFEESILDAEGNVISKRYVIPTGTDQPMILAINQRFRGGQLQEIMYPASMFGEPFRVAYQYDKLGRMVSVGVPGQPQRFLAITYNANDQVLSETFSPLRQHWFTRNYTYNEPGFPIEIDDPFLRQELSYTDRGYGRHGYADGTVSRTKYTAKWHNSASRYGLGVRSSHQLPPLCYDGLKSEGYLDDNDQQTRIFYQDLEFKLPPACAQDATSADIKRVLGKYGFPKEYGFRFDYGNLMELTKAKYFVGNILQESKPLLHDTFFEEIQNIDMEASQNIWRLLLEWGFISQENGHGKVNKYLLDEILNLSDLGNHEFSTIFKDKRPLIPEIVRLLQKYSATELGQAEFDVQSYEIDANGNHKRFFAGFEHYQLKYEPNSNRIAEVRHQNTADGQDAKVFKMRHDSRGNVVQALHKNIESMEYHPVSNRLQKVTMSDGTTITLQYDARGERVYKRVTNENGQNTRGIHYLRDEKSRSLVECQVTFMAPDQNPDVLVTMYIYGPNGLIGFVRRDQFYSVISDHLGSVRLVVRDGEVVAAYDYMPYGNLMRIYGHNPDAHISYRFNGQEWDPEFRLYNYHARFYDPVIGRFYQMDPSSQYFSPYKYAGNSPVSMVDPSGEVAVLPIAFVVGSILIGAYLGGYIMNDHWNPFKWNWTHKHTYVGIFYGGTAGAMLPVGFSATTDSTSYSSADTKLRMSVGHAIIHINSLANAKWKSYSVEKPCALSYKFSVEKGIKFDGIRFRKFSLITGLIENSKSAISATEQYNSVPGNENIFSMFNSMATGTSHLDMTTLQQRKIIIGKLLFQIYNSFSVHDYFKFSFNRKSDFTQRRTPSNRQINLLHELIENMRNSNFTSIIITNLSITIKNLDIISIYPRGNFMNSFFLQTNNNSSKSIATQNDPDFIETITNSINDIPRKVHELKTAFNVENFIEQLEQKIHFKTIIFNNETNVRICGTAVWQNFASKNYQIEHDLIRSIIIESFIFEIPKNHSIQLEYTNVKNELNSLNQKLSMENIEFAMRLQNQIEKDYLEKRLKDLKYKENNLIAKEIDSILNIILSTLEEYRENLIGWQTDTTSATKSNNFDSNDLNYFISSQMELPVLERCQNCMISQPNSRNTIDDEWLKLLNSNYNRKNKSSLSKRIDLNEKPISTQEFHSKPANNISTNRFKRMVTPLLPSVSKLKSFDSFSSGSLFSNSDTNNNKTHSTRHASHSSPHSSTWNCLDFGDNFLGKIAKNDTLLLAEVVLSKLFNNLKLCKLWKRTTIATVNHLSVRMQQVISCNLIELFESSVMESAKVINISTSHLNLSFIPELYRKINRLIARKQFDEINILIFENAECAISEEAIGDKRRKLFLNHFYGLNLNSEIDNLLMSYELCFATS